MSSAAGGSPRGPACRPTCATPAPSGSTSRPSSTATCSAAASRTTFPPSPRRWSTSSPDASQVKTCSPGRSRRMARRLMGYTRRGALMPSQTRTRLSVVPRQRRSPEGVAARTPVAVPAQRTPPDGLGQVTAMARDGFTGLRHLHPSPRRALLLVIWVVGIVGDAVTTLLLLNQPGHEEANPSAVIGMGLLGVPGYV